MARELQVKRKVEEEQKKKDKELEVKCLPVFCPANHPSLSSPSLARGQEEEWELNRDLLSQTLLGFLPGLS